jgi:hypothetical protein
LPEVHSHDANKKDSRNERMNKRNKEHKNKEMKKWHTIKKNRCNKITEGKNLGTLLYKLKGKWENEAKSRESVKGETVFRNTLIYIYIYIMDEINWTEDTK